MKVTLKGLQKQAVVLPGQQQKDVVIIFLQMLDQVQKHGFWRVTVKNMLVMGIAFSCRIKNVAEQLFAKGLQKEVLCFKMGVKSGSADVGGGDNLTDSDLAELFLRQKLCKCSKNSFPGFSLPTIHNFLRTFFKICSVWNRGRISYVDFCTL
jgi:hypothetical protein